MEFLRPIEHPTPAGLAIHGVADNYATHKTSAVRQWLLRHPRWHLPFIPNHSSWLNQVERFFAKITLEVIRRGWFASVSNLRKAILAHISTHNKDSKLFAWTATAERIFEKIKIFCSKLTCHYSGAVLKRLS